jgi:hypothetical protein
MTSQCRWGDARRHVLAARAAELAGRHRGRLSREASEEGGGGHDPEHGGDRAERVANILVDLGYALLGQRMRPA